MGGGIILKKFKNDEKGSAIIETAVVIPLLIGLFMGLVFFANAMRYKLVLNMAAKEGAREYAVTLGDTNKASSKAYSEAGLGFVGGVNVTVSGGEVKVEKPYAFYVPESGDYRLNLKASHRFKEEIIELHYKKGWDN